MCKTLQALFETVHNYAACRNNRSNFFRVTRSRHFKAFLESKIYQSKYAAKFMLLWQRMLCILKCYWNKSSGFLKIKMFGNRFTFILRTGPISYSIHRPLKITEKLSTLFSDAYKLIIRGKTSQWGISQRLKLGVIWNTAKKYTEIYC